MLSCDETENLLSAYYDGELGVAAAQQVEQHLASCKSCKAKLEDMNLLKSAVKIIDFPDADEKFQKALHERLEMSASSLRPNRFGKIFKIIRPYAAAAACVVLAAGIYTAADRGYLSPKTPIPVTDEHTMTVISPALPDNTGSNAENEIQTEADNTVRGKVVSGTADPKTVRESVSSNVSEKNDDGNTAESAKPADSRIAEDTKNVAEADVPDNMATDEQSALSEPQARESYVPSESSAVNSGEAQPDGEKAVLASSFSAGGGCGGDSAKSAEPEVSVTVTFVLEDSTKRDYVEEILGRYGVVEVGVESIRVRVLSANLEACVATLRAIDGVSELGSAKTDGDGEHSYVQVNF